MAAIERARYRSRQFVGALLPRVDPALRHEGLSLLGAGERRLFASMAPRDQQHCLDVYRRLRDAGHGDRELLAAALLHDAGKGRVALWHRVAYVLLRAAAPGLLERLAAPAGAPWPAVSGLRQALFRCLHHERLGARLAREAGCSETVAALIEGDAGAAGAARLAALAAADEAGA
jgi:hypothetical protein